MSKKSKLNEKLVFTSANFDPDFALKSDELAGRCSGAKIFDNLRHYIIGLQQSQSFRSLDWFPEEFNLPQSQIKKPTKRKASILQSNCDETHSDVSSSDIDDSKARDLNQTRLTKRAQQNPKPGSTLSFSSLFLPSSEHASHNISSEEIFSKTLATQSFGDGEKGASTAKAKEKGSSLQGRLLNISKNQYEAKSSGSGGISDGRYAKLRKVMIEKQEEERKAVAQKNKDNVINKMEAFQAGPLSVLYNCMKKGVRLKVWTRRYKGLRGVCTGYLIAFDKHMNLAMIDVDEVYTLEIRTLSQAEQDEIKAKKKADKKNRYRLNRINKECNRIDEENVHNNSNKQFMENDLNSGSSSRRDTIEKSSVQGITSMNSSVQIPTSKKSMHDSSSANDVSLKKSSLKDILSKKSSLQDINSENAVIHVEQNNAADIKAVDFDLSFNISESSEDEVATNDVIGRISDSDGEGDDKECAVIVSACLSGVHSLDDAEQVNKESDKEPNALSTDETSEKSQDGTASQGVRCHFSIFSSLARPRDRSVPSKVRKNSSEVSWMRKEITTPEDFALKNKNMTGDDTNKCRKDSDEKDASKVTPPLLVSSPTATPSSSSSSVPSPPPSPLRLPSPSSVLPPPSLPSLSSVLPPPLLVSSQTATSSTTPSPPPLPPLPSPSSVLPSPAPPPPGVSLSSAQETEPKETKVVNETHDGLQKGDANIVVKQGRDAKKADRSLFRLVKLELEPRIHYCEMERPRCELDTAAGDMMEEQRDPRLQKMKWLPRLHATVTEGSSIESEKPIGLHGIGFEYDETGKVDVDDGRCEGDAEEQTDALGRIEVASRVEARRESDERRNVVLRGQDELPERCKSQKHEIIDQDFTRVSTISGANLKQKSKPADPRLKSRRTSEHRSSIEEPIHNQTKIEHEISKHDEVSIENNVVSSTSVKDSCNVGIVFFENESHYDRSRAKMNKESNEKKDISRVLPDASEPPTGPKQMLLEENKTQNLKNADENTAVKNKPSALAAFFQRNRIIPSNKQKSITNMSKNRPGLAAATNIKSTDLVFSREGNTRSCRRHLPTVSAVFDATRPINGHIFKERHVNQLFIRGDNVAMVAYDNQN